jgi:membrane protein
LPSQKKRARRAHFELREMWWIKDSERATAPTAVCSVAASFHALISGKEDRVSQRQKSGVRDAERDGSAENPPPQPEQHEPKVADPSLGDLSKRDYMAIFVRAGKESIKDHIPNLAAALAYYAFLAIPSVLLVAVGVFGLAADEDAVGEIVDRLETVAPPEALTLVRESLERVTESQANAGLAMIVAGSVLALWTLTGSMTTLMWALNTAYDREETRGFVKQRLTALVMVFLLLIAFVLAFGLLVLGPHVSGWIGSAVGFEALVKWLWWTAQWPILILALLAVFATVLYLGPDVDHPRWRFLTLGTVTSVLVWLLASGAFAVFVGQVGSYNKAWGSLAAVIIMLTWLWISGLALLFGAEVNAESERSRELRRGEREAATELQAPPKD